MNLELKKYFVKNPEAFCRKGVSFNDIMSLRRKTALKQSTLSTVPYMEVLSYVNEFLEELKENNTIEKNDVEHKYIELDGKQHTIVNNGIIVTGCKWDSKWNITKGRYEYYDKKYDVIKEVFNLSSPFDIVWMKFTQKGHLGVVGKGVDINYNYSNTSGKFVKMVKDVWNENIVLIFPLTPEILNEYDNSEIELAVGNYLIYKQVPIIDYYSHNY